MLLVISTSGSLSKAGRGLAKLKLTMRNATEQREELARLTRYANQLAADLADTRTRIRALVTSLGLPKLTLFRPATGAVSAALQFGPEFSIEEALPPPWKTVRLRLPDGSRPLGVWTGFEWWSQGRLQYPTHWEVVLKSPASEETGIGGEPAPQARKQARAGGA